MEIDLNNLSILVWVGFEIARFGQPEQSSQDGLRFNEVNAFNSLRRSRYFIDKKPKNKSK